MARNVKRFAREIAEYINKHIVGTDSTVIMNCMEDGPVMNRGKAIPIAIKMPEDVYLSDDMNGMGPCFYAEELMEEFPDGTVAAIAEIVNARTSECYGDMIAVMRAQSAAMKKTIDDYPKEDLILTALPSGNPAVPPENRDEFVMKDLKGAGLTLTVKGALCDNGSCEGQTYFTPVRKPSGREISVDDWGNAEANSLRASKIRVEFFPVSVAGHDGIPVAGSVADAKAFYDWFYLVSLRAVWEDIAKASGAETIYIRPQNAYQASFLVEFPDTAGTAAMDKLKDIFMNAAETESGDMPVFALDCGSFGLSEYVRGKSGNERNMKGE